MTRIDRARPGLTLLRSAAVAAAASLMIMLSAGCAAVGAPVSSGDPGSPVPTAATPVGQRIVMRFGDEVVPATLADTEASQAFANVAAVDGDVARSDGSGQVRSAPGPDLTRGAAPVTDPEAGGLYYAPGTQTLAVFYDDLGQTVPPPGLIRLGAVDGDLALIAAAGNRIRVRVDLAESTSS